jgi:hypothetical protein
MKTPNVVRSLEPVETEGPFENEAVLPSQFTTSAATKLNGVHRLMAAVLADAIHCFCGNGERWHDAEEARQWLFARGGSELFAFENVCNELGIDCDALREQLTRWRASREFDFCQAARRERRFSRWVAAA